MRPISCACIMLVLAGTAAQARLFGPDALYEGIKGKFIDEAPKRSAVSAGASASTTASRGITAAAALGDVWDGVPNAKLEAYLNGIVDKLQKNWPGEKRQIKVTLTADSSYRASAWPDGTLRIARGVLRDADTEDEIAALLGHEVGHVLLNHFARTEIDEARSRTISNAASAATTGIVLSNTTVTKSGGQAQLAVKNQASVQQDVQRTQLIKSALDQAAEILLNSPWRREQEDEADLLAIDLAYRAGYSANAIKPVLQRTKSAEVKTKSKLEELQKQYQASLEEQIKSGNISNIQRGLVDTLSSAVLAKASDVKEYLTRTHPNIDDRIKDTDAYIAREYELADIHRTQKEELVALQAAADIKAVLDNYDKADEAMLKLGAEEPGAALMLATDSAKGPTSSHPYPLQALSRAQSQSGNARLALANMERAAASPVASYKTILSLASLNQQAGKFAEAETDIHKAGDRFGSAEVTYPALIQLYKIQGDMKKVDETYALCRQVKSNELVAQCRASAGKEECEDSTAFACKAKGAAGDVSGAFSAIGKSLGTSLFSR